MGFYTIGQIEENTPSGGGFDKPILPADEYLSRCIGVIVMGGQPSEKFIKATQSYVPNLDKDDNPIYKGQIRLFFEVVGEEGSYEVEKEKEDGTAKAETYQHVFYKDFNETWGEKAAIYKLLVSLFGKDKVDNKEIDLGDLEHLPLILNIGITKSKRNRIESIVKLPKMVEASAVGDAATETFLVNFRAITKDEAVESLPKVAQWVADSLHPENYIEGGDAEKKESKEEANGNLAAE